MEVRDAARGGCEGGCGGPGVQVNGPPRGVWAGWAHHAAQDDQTGNGPQEPTYTPLITPCTHLGLATPLFRLRLSHMRWQGPDVLHDSQTVAVPRPKIGRRTGARQLLP